MTRVLVTNDDGIDSPGLHHLARVLRAAGHTVVVAAPADDASGTSASITYPGPGEQLTVQRRDLPDLPDVAAYALAAPPALITLVAVRGGLGEPPDLVVSGVNRGANTGHAILHSGTVGAALTAAANGRPAVAVSLQLDDEAEQPAHWEAATRYLPALLPVLRQPPTPIVLNLNAPNLPAGQLRGLREARLAAFGAVQTTVHTGDGYVELSLADTEASREPGTDSALLAEGYATVSAVTPILEVPDVSLHAVLDTIT